MPFPVFLRITLFLVSLLVYTSNPASAQTAPSHTERLAELTMSCLETAVDGASSFRFLPQGQTPLVASPLVAAWTSNGKTVFLEPSDAEAAARAPLLVVTTDQSTVMLSRSGRNDVRRDVSVDLTWWLSSAAGDVVGTDTCREDRDDVLSREDAHEFAVEGSPVLDPDIPRRSRLLGAVEPVVLLGATAVGTYLLFNLRSRRSDDG